MKLFQKICAFVLVAVIVTLTPMATYAQTPDSNGITFSSKDSYRITKNFSESTNTYEAWIKVSSSLASSKRAGVILGNYSQSGTCVSFEIHKSGNPRIYYKPADTDATDHIFTNIDVRTGEWLHLAITIDRDAGTINCYVNGELKGSVAKAMPDIKASSACKIGGDLRQNNTCYFLGAIRSAAVYSDTRTQEEVAADMNNLGTDSLVAGWNFSAQDINHICTDVSGNGYNVRYTKTWLDIDEVEPVKDYAYSFVVIGDTQTVSYNSPDELGDIYDWIVANKESKNIQYVMHMGDFTEKDADAEWANNYNQVSKLNGVVPYSLVRGNHDSSAKFNSTFNTEAYTNSFEGSYGNKLENTWRELKVGKIKYLIFTLDIGASDDVLNWSSEIIEAHPYHNVIITTHIYLYSDGTTHDAGDTYPATKYGGTNNGVDIWEKLVKKHENIVLVSCGHISYESVLTTQEIGDNGNVVTHMMVDPQTIDKNQGSSGMVAILYFSEDGSQVDVEYFSTIRNQYYLSDNLYQSFEMNVVKSDADQGDFDGNGVVTSSDFNNTLLYVAGMSSTELSEEQIDKVDMDKSGKIDSTDVLMIQQKLLGLI